MCSLMNFTVEERHELQLPHLVALAEQVGALCIAGGGRHHVLLLRLAATYCRVYGMGQHGLGNHTG